MRLALLILYASIAYGQIQPEAERLYRAAQLQAFASLSNLDLEAEVELSLPVVNRPPRILRKHISVSVREKEAKLAETSNSVTTTYILSNDSVWIADEGRHSFAARPAALRSNSFLMPAYMHELLPATTP